MASPFTGTGPLVRAPPPARYTPSTTPLGTIVSLTRFTHVDDNLAPGRKQTRKFVRAHPLGPPNDWPGERRDMPRFVCCITGRDAYFSPDTEFDLAGETDRVVPESAPRWDWTFWLGAPPPPPPGKLPLWHQEPARARDLSKPYIERRTR